MHKNNQSLFVTHNSPFSNQTALFKCMTPSAEDDFILPNSFSQILLKTAELRFGLKLYCISHSLHPTNLLHSPRGCDFTFKFTGSDREYPGRSARAIAPPKLSSSRLYGSSGRVPSDCSIAFGDGNAQRAKTKRAPYFFAKERENRFYKPKKNRNLSARRLVGVGA